MADLATTDVTVLKTWSETLSNGEVLYGKQVSMSITAAGTTSASSRVLASAFGLTTVRRTTPFVKSDDSAIVPAAPSIDGTLILLNSTPATVTGTYRAIIEGV